MSFQFQQLHLEDWRQFESIDIDFHPRLTVLTGANATGKSTILGILARHFNWNKSYSSAPVRVKESGGRWINVGRRRAESLSSSPDRTNVGELTYDLGQGTRISVPTNDGNQRQSYDLILPNQQAVDGLFLSSHRAPSGTYSAVQTIPTTFISAGQQLQEYTQYLRNHSAGAYSPKSPQLVLKEMLLAAAIFGGPGTEYVDFSPEVNEVWTGFQRVLGTVLPNSLGFRRLRTRVSELILETNSGDFVMDDSSGGISAIIEVSWQIFLQSLTNAPFTVLMDEPENHLHPSLQRELIPRLLEAFPQARFVVATHSPFVVTATAESAVYVLDYDSQSRVRSRFLDYANKASGAEETLKRVLGVESTMPIWAEDEFARVVNKHLTGALSSDGLRALRHELELKGLAGDFPRAVNQIISAKPREGSL